MMFANLKPTDPVFEELCCVARAEPDQVAAVVIFIQGRTTIVVSTTYSFNLVIAVTNGVQVDKVSYPSGSAMWHISRTYDKNDLVYAKGFNTDPNAWTIRGHDGKPFKAEGGKRVIVYTEKTRSA